MVRGFPQEPRARIPHTKTQKNAKKFDPFQANGESGKFNVQVARIAVAVCIVTAAVQKRLVGHDQREGQH